MNDATNKRKLEHIRIIEDDRDVDRRKLYFDAFRLHHRALPEIDFEEVDTSLTFMGKKLAFPLLISSMTGGDDEDIRNVNRNLALAAQATGTAMAVGSQRVMFTRSEAEASFALREYAPDALLFANLGAVQLNYGFDLKACRKAVEVLQADGLYLHLNAVQEAVQPEGQTRFSGLAEQIAQIARELEVPVIVKEVGAGIGPADGLLLAEQGIEYIDVAGAGGTSWSRIEHYRRCRDSQRDLGLVFQDWGHPTPDALRALSSLRDRITLIGSGGIRTGVDMVKAMALGASLCGVARPFLTPALESSDAVIERIEQLREEFTTAMFLVGIDKAADLIGNDALLIEGDHS
jgi:isopentenyl-diphosphate delta-isomerase